MSKKEKVKNFLKEHKSEIKGYAICIGSVAAFIGAGVLVGRTIERHNMGSLSTTAKMGLAMNQASKQVLVAGDFDNGIGKVADIGAIVARGLEEAGSEGHLDDTVIGYMVYTK